MPCCNIPKTFGSIAGDRSDGLCPACCDIFQIQHFKCFEEHFFKLHFHSKIQDHLERATCPGCRLIGSFFSDSWGVSNMSSETDIILHLKPFWNTKCPGYNHLGNAITVSVNNNRCGPGGEAAGMIFMADQTALWPSTGDPLDSGCQNCGRILPFVGRLVPPNIDVSLVRGYMQFCDANHTKCKPTRQPSRHAFRLIDLYHWKLVNASPNDRYVALSYVWGRDKFPMLTTMTLPEFLVDGGLRQVAFPQTVRDAMEFARDLGYRYIWVDSFCIIQNDHHDKEQQLPIMFKIFRDANLVIVAATGDSSHAGLSGVGEKTRDPWQHTERIGSSQYITTEPGVHEAIRQTTWDTRGWTFQEALVARRLLVFTTRRIFWVCQESTWPEDVMIEPHLQISEAKESSSLRGHMMARGRGECRTNDYCRNVETFTRRHFTVESDTIWAYIGILEARALYFPKGYIWGLPYEILDAALLWQARSYVCGRGDGFKKALHTFTRRDTRYTLSYPSWSWLSIRGAVYFSSPCGKIASEVSWYPTLDVQSQHKRGICGQAMTYIRSMWRRIGWESDIFQNQPHPDGFIMDYGLLHFGASVANVVVRSREPTGWLLWLHRRVASFRTYVRKLAILTLERLDDPGDIVREHVDICLPSGEVVCQVEVPTSYLGLRQKRLGQVVLISSNVAGQADDNCVVSTNPLDCANIVHVRGCDHIQSHNIMLIEWRGNIAYRHGLGDISREGWAKLKAYAEKKDIILG